MESTVLPPDYITSALAALNCARSGDFEQMLTCLSRRSLLRKHLCRHFAVFPHVSRVRHLELIPSAGHTEHHSAEMCGEQM